MRWLSLFVVCAFLVVAGTPAPGGEPGATFGSRLSCSYSSFAVAEVKTVRRGSIDVAFTKSLLRRPPEETARIKISPKYDRCTRGEKLLINAWRFPPAKEIDWTSFPNSYYHGGRTVYWVLAHIGSDGKLRVVYPDTEAILNWLYSTGNWDVRIAKADLTRDGARRYAIVFPDGRRETLIFPVRGQAAPRHPAHEAGKRPKR